MRRGTVLLPTCLGMEAEVLTRYQNHISVRVCSWDIPPVIDSEKFVVAPAGLEPALRFLT